MARPKKSSNYKVIQDIDLSKNNIYNVNAIVGNSYDFEPNDLIITTYDTSEASPPANAGNLILRAGVADESLANSGSVHIFAGNEVTPTIDSTVIDILSSSSSSSLTGVNSKVKNGITIDPDEGVFIKSEISSEGKVSIEAKKNLSIESKDKTTFNSPNVEKNVTKEEIDTVKTLKERFVENHTEIAKELNVSAGGNFVTKIVDEDGVEKSVTDYSSMENSTLAIQSHHKNTAITGDAEHSYIKVGEIEVDKIVTEGANDNRVVRKTFTSSDTNTSESYILHAGSSNPSDATLTVESNHEKTDNSYINVDKIKVDGTVTEGEDEDGKRVVRTVFATTDTTKVSKHLSITAPAFSLDAERKATDTEETEESSLTVTNITSTNNALENLTLGGEKDNPTGGKSPTGSFVVDNNSVDIDTNTLNINVPNNLHEDNPTGETVFELSADTSSSMHIDEVKIDDKLLIGEEVVTTDSATGKESTSIKKSTSAKIYTKNFVLDTNTKDGATGLSITGNYGLEITDHYPKDNPTESYINVKHINVGTADVVTDRATDVIVSNSIKTKKPTGTTNNDIIDVIFTGDSEKVSVDNGSISATNKIRDVEINSKTINIKGGSKNNLHITSSLTDGEVGRLKTKGLNEGDSFIETDDLRINKNFYANQFYIYWDDRINSLVFANSEQTPKG